MVRLVGLRTREREGWWDLPPLQQGQSITGTDRIGTIISVIANETGRDRVGGLLQW